MDGIKGIQRIRCFDVFYIYSIYGFFFFQDNFFRGFLVLIESFLVDQICFEVRVICYILLQDVRIFKVFKFFFKVNKIFFRYIYIIGMVELF